MTNQLSLPLRDPARPFSIGARAGAGARRAIGRRLRTLAPAAWPVRAQLEHLERDVFGREITPAELDELRAGYRAELCDVDASTAPLAPGTRVRVTRSALDRIRYAAAAAHEPRPPSQGTIVQVGQRVLVQLGAAVWPVPEKHVRRIA